MGWDSADGQPSVNSQKRKPATAHAFSGDERLLEKQWSDATGMRRTSFRTRAWALGQIWLLQVSFSPAVKESLPIATRERKETCYGLT